MIVASGEKLSNLYAFLGLYVYKLSKLSGDDSLTNNNLFSGVKQENLECAHRLAGKHFFKFACFTPEIKFFLAKLSLPFSLI